MKRFMSLIILLLTFLIVYPYETRAFGKGGIIKTGIVMQNWRIEADSERIAELSIPINVIFPVNEKIHIQLYNSPALARFGDFEIGGLSDTWIRGTYILIDGKMMVSGGIGLPTGKTGLTGDEASLSALLSRNVFKFQLPVFGQGFTLSTGVIYAHSFNDKFAIGSGLNFVYQGKYKYMEYDFDPGEQMGMNVGFDYKPFATLKLDMDFLYTFYMRDKLNNTEFFGAAAKLGFKFGLVYGTEKRVLNIEGRYRHSGKNDTWDGTTLITEPKNSNVKQMELETFYHIGFSQMFSLDILFDSRLYTENEYGVGQANIYGVGIKNNIQLTPNIEVSILFRQFSGDAYVIADIQSCSGKDFQIGTTIKL